MLLVTKSGSVMCFCWWEITVAVCWHSPALRCLCIILLYLHLCRFCEEFSVLVEVRSSQLEESSILTLLNSHYHIHLQLRLGPRSLTFISTQHRQYEYVWSPTPSHSPIVKGLWPGQVGIIMLEFIFSSHALMITNLLPKQCLIITFTPLRLSFTFCESLTVYHWLVSYCVFTHPLQVLSASSVGWKVAPGVTGGLPSLAGSVCGLFSGGEDQLGLSLAGRLHRRAAIGWWQPGGLWDIF